MPADERGFTLLEVLVAGAIVTLVGLVGLAACQSVARVSAATLSGDRSGAALDDVMARLRDDAASAVAIVVPTSDRDGASNTGPAGAHELDFLATDSAGNALPWRYVYDAARHTLRRFDYDSSGAQGVRDVATGRIDPTATYPALTGIVAFSAATLSADALGDPARNAYSGVGGLFDHPPHAYAIPSGGSEVAGAVARGGNAIVTVSVANAGAGRIVHLAPAVLPSGFTVTGMPRWHAILYRVDQTHRFGTGLAGKSHVFINARIDVSYDGWKTRAVWCDFNLLGNPDGLDPHDPHADYRPDEAFEQAPALLADCRRLHPTPPPRASLGNAPEPGTVAPPAIALPVSAAVSK